jgi:hypothetical protein
LVYTRVTRNNKQSSGSGSSSEVYYKNSFKKQSLQYFIYYSQACSPFKHETQPAAAHQPRSIFFSGIITLQPRPDNNARNNDSHHEQLFKEG